MTSILHLLPWSHGVRPIMVSWGSQLAQETTRCLPLALGVLLPILQSLESHHSLIAGIILWSNRSLVAGTVLTLPHYYGNATSTLK